jgi:hypothetical protein
VGHQPDPRAVSHIACHGGNTHGRHAPGMTTHNPRHSSRSPCRAPAPTRLWRSGRSRRPPPPRSAAIASSPPGTTCHISTRHDLPQCLQDCSWWATCIGPNDDEGEFARKIKKWESNMREEPCERATMLYPINRANVLVGCGVVRTRGKHKSIEFIFRVRTQHK